MNKLFPAKIKITQLVFVDAVFALGIIHFCPLKAAFQILADTPVIGINLFQLVQRIVHQFLIKQIGEFGFIISRLPVSQGFFKHVGSFSNPVCCHLIHIHFPAEDGPAMTYHAQKGWDAFCRVTVSPDEPGTAVVFFQQGKEFKVVRGL